MRRGVRYPVPAVPARSRPLAPHDVPLEERVDGYGLRQRAGTGRALRDVARQEDAEEAGWWWHDGEGSWDFYGADNPPEPT